ncbi:cytochrome c3 family protein [Bdellovibrionota bacterium FG-1]
MKRFFPFIFTLFLLSPPALAQERLATPLFEAKISAPTLVRVCGDRVWTYSVELGELRALDPNDGKLLSTQSLGAILPGQLITSLACNRSSFFLATIQKYEGSEKLQKSVFSLFRVAIPGNNQSLQGAERLILPEDALVRDLEVLRNTFFLVQNSTYKSTDCLHWTPLAIPFSQSIPPKDLDLSKNPFADWQEGFLISQGRYSRLEPLEDGSLMLLDPFRSHVVFFGKDSGYRWGRWGTRNGTLMFAKSIAMVSDRWVAISDVGLKLVFFYDRLGNYIGSIGSDAGTARFGYPLGLASWQDRLYVADYFGNRILAFKVNMGTLSAGADNPDLIALDKTSFAENDLFRNPDTQKTYAMVRCLNCHDGLEKFSLDKFILEKKHHPVGVEVKITVDLKLAEGHKIDCFTCHQNHHQSLSGVVTGQFGEEHTVKQVPFMLRKPFKELCLTCHKDKESVEHNHLGLSSTKLQKFKIQVKSCSQCHQMHSAEPRQLRKTVSDLCISCHGQARKPKSHPFGFAKLDKNEVQVTCLSCHSVHGSEKAAHFSRHKSKDSAGSCLNCHKDRILLIEKNEHLKASPQLRQRVQWADDASFCLNCHDPHQDKKRVSLICVSCHQDRVKKSHDKRIDQLFAMARLPLPPNIHLSDGWLTCSTCHDPHAPSTQRSLLRPNLQSLLPVCTSACHTAESANMQFVETYHSKRGQKGKAKEKE